MAVDDKRRSFLGIPATVWWELCKRFQRSMPAQVTPSYLQTVLTIQEGHARNLIPMLKSIALISDDERPTPLANEWRTDEGYRDACTRILAAVYPTELRDAVPPDETNRSAAKRWFMRETGVGEVAASRMASFYTLLSQGDPAVESGQRPKASVDSSQPATRARQKGRPATSSATRKASAHAVAPIRNADSDPSPLGPSVHIDVQIHIPSDASGDQIDAIFASMAKHLYRNQ